MLEASTTLGFLAPATSTIELGAMVSAVTNRPPGVLVKTATTRRALGWPRLARPRYADACNILVPDPGQSRHKIDVLRRHCEDIGRDEAEIEKTSLVEIDLRPGRMGPVDVVALARAQRDEAIDHLIVNMRRPARAGQALRHSGPNGERG
jgi:alkanesulfonate monooxygenase SsuD/methylene tetrahydromethanopterin reductase-like flavin-dependent oxidoreductase (luciferase family)